MITVSVPGKVILMGDHAVVHGKPGLIAAINKRLTVEVSEGKSAHMEYIVHILGVIKHHFRLSKMPQMRIRIHSDIPEGYHLGSSAAVAVGVVGAVSYFLKKMWNPTLINQLAYEADKYIHKTPSGVDNTTITFGGFLWYRKELEFLRSFWQLPLKLPSALNHFSLIDTGRPKENTGEMVAFVKSQKNLQTFLDANETQTKRVAIAIKEGDEKMLLDAIRKGERTLESIGVVGKKVIPVIRAIEKSGGAAKILGGGGRAAGVGYLLCYTRKPLKGSLPIKLGEEGIRLERKL